MGYFIHPCLGGADDNFVNTACLCVISANWFNLRLLSLQPSPVFYSRATLHDYLRHAPWRASSRGGNRTHYSVEYLFHRHLHKCTTLTSPRSAHGAVGHPRRWSFYTRLLPYGGYNLIYFPAFPCAIGVLQPMVCPWAAMGPVR